MNEKILCPLCGDYTEQKIVFEAQGLCISVGSVAQTPHTRGDRLYGRGSAEMNLLECLECGYIYNQAFDDTLMQESYKEDLYFTPKAISGVMSKFIIDLKDEILSYSKPKGVFLEIAPGGCDLLVALARECGDSTFYSIDPSQSSVLYAKEPNIMHIQRFFDKQILREIPHKIDFIIFRHLIEHIDKPKEFIESVVSALDEGGMIYVETPNGEEIFRNKRFYELRYEHVSYWTLETLENAFIARGCEVVEKVFYYNMQWFGLLLRKKSQQNPIQLLPQSIYKDLLDSIKKLNTALQNFQHIVLYGGSSHATSLVNYLSKENLAKIQCAIDLDTRRQGKFIQKTDICIKAPNVENLSGADCIVMAMPTYEEKVVENEIKPLINSAGGGGLLSYLLAVA